MRSFDLSLEGAQDKRVKKGKGTVWPLMEVFHNTATECHLSYGITRCYLLPDTSEYTPP